MSDKAESSLAPGVVRIVVTIEGRISSETNISIETVAAHKDGSLDGPQVDTLTAETFMSALMLTSAELHKLGLLMGYEMVERVSHHLYGTGEGIENAHAAAEYAAGRDPGDESDSVD